MARVASSRASCPRASVGAIIVRENRVLSSGMNGSISGEAHCTDIGCDIVDNHCERVEHAERNAIYYAAQHGVSLRGATAYITIPPCWACTKGMISAGIVRVVYSNDYKLDPRVVDLFNRRTDLKMEKYIC